MTIKLAELLVKAMDCEGLKQLDDKGQGVAVIATLNVIDKDQDVTQPGAFGNGQTVQMVPAHNWQHVPIGKGRIFEEGNEALFAFQLNMKLGHGRAWFEAAKFDLDNPPAKMQWSYGFSLLDSGFGEHEGQQVRFLKSLRVHEVSPVILGAGVNTRTLALKSDRAAEGEAEKALALTRKLVQEYWARRERAIRGLGIRES
jgi:hypothetical protein